MLTRLTGSAILLLAASACGDGGGGNVAANAQGNGATPAVAGTSDAQNRMRSLPEGQRNGVLIRAIRDAKQTCQHVEQSELTQTSNNVPVYMATCDDGAVYAVAIADDGTATVQPVMPASPGR